MKKIQMNGFTLVELLVVIGILGILMGALFPAITSAMLRANMSSCAMRGRNLYVGIVGANTEREAAGLASVWPKTSTGNGDKDDSDDIAAKTFTKAEEYFTALFDMENINDSQKWSPYVSGVDIGVLSGSGVVPVSGGTTKLEGKNVAWTIAANVQDEMEDVVPVLVTRNVDSKKLKTDTYDGKSTDTVGLGKAGGADYDTPFANKAFVMIRKGGAAVNLTTKYAKLNVIYNKQSFTVPEGDTKFEYITPSK